MNRFTKVFAALAAIVGIALLSGAWLTQDPGKEKQDPKVQAKEAAAKEAAMKARAEHMMAFKKAFPTLKVPLSQAITLAETETKGKAHSADIELGKDGKLKIEIGLLVGDEFKRAYVDNETKKVTVPKPGDKDEDDEEEEGEEGH